MSASSALPGPIVTPTKPPPGGPKLRPPRRAAAPPRAERSPPAAQEDLGWFRAQAQPSTVDPGQVARFRRDIPGLRQPLPQQPAEFGAGVIELGDQRVQPLISRTPRGQR